MATIIKSGHLPAPELFVERCWKCNTVFRFEEREVTKTWPYGLAKKPGFFVNCPHCKTELYTDLLFVTEARGKAKGRNMGMTNAQKSALRTRMAEELVSSIVHELDPSNALFHRGKPFTMVTVLPEVGLRSIAAKITAPYQIEALLKKLKEGTNAIDMVPFTFRDEEDDPSDRGVKPIPDVFINGDHIKFQVRMPERYQSNLNLADMPWKPLANGYQFYAGIDTLREKPYIVTLDDRNPHMLFAGVTGSGKSNAMKSAMIQLGRDRSTMLVVMDAGQQNVDWLFFNGHPAMFLPVANNIHDMETAAAMLREQIRLRMKDSDLRSTRLVVAVDEVQELSKTETGSEFVLGVLREIATQGRKVGIHLMVGTQYPSSDELGGRAFITSLGFTAGFHANDGNMSRLIFGENSQVHAEMLSMRGDSWCVTWDNPNQPTHVQWAYIPESDLYNFSRMYLGGGNTYTMEGFTEYPDIEIDNGDGGVGRPNEPFSADRIAAALIALEDYPDADNIDAIPRDPFNRRVRSIAGHGVGSARVADLQRLAWELRDNLARMRQPTRDRN